MKITRKMLLITIASLGAFIIIYSLVKYFAGLEFNETVERRMMDIVMIAALGLFIYNRKLAKDERNAREAAEEAERRAEEEPVEIASPDDDNLPHWERK